MIVNRPLDARGRRRDTKSPFETSRLLYRLGFRWQEEMVPVNGSAPGTPYVQSWTSWKIVRQRLTWHGLIPLWRWKP